MSVMGPVIQPRKKVMGEPTVSSPRKAICPAASASDGNLPGVLEQSTCARGFPRNLRDLFLSSHDIPGGDRVNNYPISMAPSLRGNEKSAGASKESSRDGEAGVGSARSTDEVGERMLMRTRWREGALESKNHWRERCPRP